LTQMEGMLRTIYDDHISLLRYLSLSGMPKPQSLMLAAQFTLSADLRGLLTKDPFNATKIRQLVAQAYADRVELDMVDLPYLANQRMLRAMQQLQQSLGNQELNSALEILESLRELPFEVDYWETQNRWYKIWRLSFPVQEIDHEWMKQLRILGTRLDIEVDQLIVDS